MEVANSPTPAAVRDAKAPARATLTFPAGAFSASLDGVKNYSTVTDFARFRGWSTSFPRAVASSHANTCNGTVATSG